MGKQVERIVNAERVEDLIAVFGSFDENIKRIEEALDVHVVNRGTDLRVSGDEEMADKAVRTLEGLLLLGVGAAERDAVARRQHHLHVAEEGERTGGAIGQEDELPLQQLRGVVGKDNKKGNMNRVIAYFRFSGKSRL